MFYKIKFRDEMKNFGKKDTKSDQARDIISKGYNFLCVTLCLVGFSLTSFWVFVNFINCTTLVSTTVVPSPDESLELPILFICNSSAYKEQILDTSLNGFKNNTMRLEDVLIDAFEVFRDPGGGILDNNIASVNHKAKEILTLTHGTCIIFDLKVKV